MRFWTIIVLISCLAVLTVPCEAADPMACVTSTCETPGKECVAKAAVTVDTCTKTARKDCNQVELPDKMKCLKERLGQCSADGSKAFTACKDGVKTCSTKCGAPGGAPMDFWCYGHNNGKSDAVYCPGLPGKSAREGMDSCTSKIATMADKSGGLSWGCEALY